MSSHILLLTALDGGKPPKSGTVQIIVNVLDVNDNHPVFNKDSYSVMLNENSAIGTTVLQVNATDLDEGSNGEVIYSFANHVNEQIRKVFEVDANKGFIIVKDEIDFETDDSYEIDIQASDRGSATLKTDKSVLVKIVDLNDNAPEIELTSFSTALPEDSRIGTTVALISVSDKDSGLNGKVVCSMTTGLPFTIMPSSQENMYSVVTKSALDREKRSQYDVTITAKDTGEPALTADKTISVLISDVNDNHPEFIVSKYDFYINSGINGKVTSLVSGDVPFTLAPSIQDNMYAVVTKSPLDREKQPFYDLTIVAKDAGNPPLSSELTLTIDVSDVNDNKPEFSRNLYTFYLNENNAQGTSLFSVTATDRDEGENAVITYHIIRDDSTDSKITPILNINPENGDIQALQSFDFEKLKMFKFLVLASDGGIPKMNSNVTVNVFILDQNDNAPVILYPLSSNGSAEGVEETARNMKAGHLVTKVRAYDADVGYNGWLLFSFELVTDHSLFGLDRYTGRIRTLQKQSGYNVRIIASDSGVPMLSSEKYIHIVVSDVNDNSPTFPLSHYTFYITENNIPSASLFSVRASDPDEDSNSLISYHIPREERDHSSFLNINHESGIILAHKSFDFETLKTFQFHVVATDGGTNSRSSNVTVHVFILDDNDNPPVILHPLSSNGSAEGVEEVPRNVPAGHLVTKVRAYDADIGYNGWLLFSLQEVSDHSLFGLDRYTGRIRTLRSFTETDEAQHKLVILVKDNGNVSLSATATVVVKLVEPKEAISASDVKSVSKADDESNVTFYLMITLGSVSALFIASIIMLVVMQCSKPRELSAAKYLQETNYDGTLCHSIQYRSGEKRYMLVGPRMSIGSTIVPGSNGNTLVVPDRRSTLAEVRSMRY
uniref:Si:ch73-379j16.2 n=1 Tax=Gadus morhua TaxID=8049 RepID=A0A8C5AK00_GADMO